MNKSEAKILIVDDEDSIRQTFAMFLSREGYGEIHTEPSLERALKAIAQTDFDLIISDIVMKGTRGTDLLRQIRETGLKCPVVMVTGFPNLETAAEAVRYGAFDYIAKPVNKETLLRFTRQALQHWELENKAKKLQEENEKYRRYLETVFRSVSDAIFTVDPQMKIVHINDTARLWLSQKGVSQGQDLGALPPEVGLACLEDARQVLDEGREVREHQLECPMPDGRTKTISLNAAPLHGENDEFHGAVIVARDITLPEPISSNNKNRTTFHGYVGVSPAMQEIYSLIENVGKVDTAVLITGESGTGKELAAEALHAESNRRDMPLVKVDCGAIAEGLLESELFGHRKGSFTGADRDRAGRLLQANGGTLFLDEIGEIPPRTQLRLLRFLQEKTFTPVGQDRPVQVDVRIIAATNVDFAAKVRRGEFREDLYYRLKVIEIHLPPLRKRTPGIPVLINHFLAKFRKELHKNITTVSDQAVAALTAYYWPGNVRQLRHVIERACVLCNGPTLLLEHLPEEICSQEGETTAPGQLSQESAPPVSAPDSFLAAGRIQRQDERIIAALQQAQGNKAKAARLLGINRSTLYRQMQRFHIAPDVASSLKVSQ
ncbi:MAG: sigma 54-interacting transcriptional regulator [Thermodesulfobacteriota bacterium]